MGRLIPLGQIPDSAVLPDGIFRVCVSKLEDVMTKEKEGKTQKAMLKLTGKVIEPKAYAGQPYYDNFVIGTEKDPEAELLETWVGGIGGKQFKRFLSKTGVAFGEEADFDEIATAVKDVELLATVVTKVQDKKNKDGTDNKYGGNINNNTTGYWAIGEQEARLNDGGASPVAATTTKTRVGGKVGGGKAGAVTGKPAPTTDITCSACRKRVPRGEMKAHVDQHMKDLAGAETETGGEAPATDDTPATDEDE
jgi:hypothetical protein